MELSPENPDTTNLPKGRNIHVRDSLHSELDIRFVRNEHGAPELHIRVKGSDTLYTVSQTDWANIAPKLIDSDNVARDLPKLLTPVLVPQSSIRPKIGGPQPQVNPIDSEIIGSAAAEYLLGDAKNNELRGKAGADVLDGGAGHDIYNPGKNDGAVDKLLFTGRDFSGNTLATADVVQNFETAHDEICLTDYFWWEVIMRKEPGHFSTRIEAGPNLITGLPFGKDIKAYDRNGDALVAYDDQTQVSTDNQPYTDKNGLTNNGQIYGNDSDNDIRGGGGHDRLIANGGNDFVFGGTGNDVLIGGTGADSLIGASGADVFVFEGKDYAPDENAPLPPGTPKQFDNFDRIMDYYAEDTIHFTDLAISNLSTDTSLLNQGKLSIILYGGGGAAHYVQVQFADSNRKLRVVDNSENTYLIDIAYNAEEIALSDYQLEVL